MPGKGIRRSACRGWGGCRKFPLFSIVLAIALAPNAWAGGLVDDCEVIRFPDAISAAMDVRRMQDAVASLDSEPEKDSDIAAEREAWYRWSLFNHWSLNVALAKQHLALSDDRQYAEAVFELEEMLREEPPPAGAWYELIYLYYFNQEPNLLQIPDHLLERAFDQMGRAEQPRKDPQLTITKVAKARWKIDNGESSDAAQLVASIDQASQSITDRFVVGYLSYLISSQRSDITGLGRAAESLAALEDNERISSCNRPLLGIALYYAAEARLLRAILLTRKVRGAVEVEHALEELFAARDLIERSRANLDPIFVPGLWALAHSKSSEVYTALMNAHSSAPLYKTDYEFYQLLAEKSRELASLY